MRLIPAITIVQVLLLASGGIAQVSETTAATANDPIAIENDYLRLAIGADGLTVQFLDKATNQDYAKPAVAQPFSSVKRGANVFPATRLTYANGRLDIRYGESIARAVVRVEAQKHYVVFEVLSLEGEGIEELVIADIELKPSETPEEPFVGCALALNLSTNVPEMPKANTRLRAMCYSRFGFQGARVALIGCPRGELRNVMKEVVSASPELPVAPPGQTPIGGPWAEDAAISRGSYLFDFGSITEQTVDKWIECAKNLGLNQIDFHTGRSLRFGDCEPAADLFPNGRASVKAVIDKLHQAGISAGLHTYAFFIAKNAPYVTPVPDPRLGKAATFTLADALPPEAGSVPVNESTKDVSTITGFFVHNSITLQIDDELITFAGASKEPPYAFTGCTRGALGTKAAPHDKGAKVHHLKECFGLFTPDADSTLLAEVANNTAETFNECGFDMIYLDALDGEAILGGAENAWHYGSKFAFEIARRLKKPALFEMSTMHHHLWYIRARMGAWDHPCRAHKRFIDIHCASNKDCRASFLPTNLGWWAVKLWDESPMGFQNEPTYPDDIEYLLCKCIGTDSGLALMGINPDTISSVPAFQRLAPLFRQYEELRRANYFSDEVRARLAEPGDEFTLEQGPDGKPRFREIQYDKHKVQGVDGWSNQWTTANRFGEQPLQFRIEALLTSTGYDAPEATVIEDFGNADVYGQQESEGQVKAGFTVSTAEVKVGGASGCFSATSERPEPNGAWARASRTFSPTFNIGKQRGLGVWVHGDGQGALLNLQLRNPSHVVGGIGEHYMRLDFTGWRYFNLIESESDWAYETNWPYSGSGYGLYREGVEYEKIETLSFWLNNLPTGKSVTCYISPVKAVPLVKGKIIRPRITVAGKTLVMPVEFESGSYVEFHSMSDCKLYGPKGELLQEVAPEGDLPAIVTGENTVTFECESLPGTSPRAHVTVITRGNTI